METSTKPAAAKKDEEDDEEEEEDDEEEDDDDEEEEEEEAPKKPQQQNNKRKAEEDHAPASKQAAVAGGPQSNEVFVGSLSYNTDDDSLTAFFKSCGKIVKASVKYDRDSGKSKGYINTHEINMLVLKK